MRSRKVEEEEERRTIYKERSERGKKRSYIIRYDSATIIVVE